jgi:hypothetical protein
MSKKTWEMEQLETKLSQAVTLMAEVSGIWERMSEQDSESVTVNYPFEQSFDEMVNSLIMWKADLIDYNKANE